MRKIAIVSPSGNYYGSEQVLHDFLRTSQHQYTVFLPSGKFMNILNSDFKAAALTSTVKSLTRLYGFLACLLCIGSLDGIYVNEGGHSRYIKLLAKLFPNKKFYLHIRLLEDCTSTRLQNLPSNVTLISVSDYIAEEVLRNVGYNSFVVPDIYIPRNNADAGFEIKHTDCNINIGIVGRLTDTKGINEIIDFCNAAEANASSPLIINFFGDINNNSSKVKDFVEHTNDFTKIRCVFHGYVKGSDNIYPQIDLLLHFNKKESLGRIAFEALDYGVPFIGINAGGIGEIARRVNLEKYMVDSKNFRYADSFVNRIEALLKNAEYIDDYKNARIKMIELCSPQTYTDKIEQIINS